MKLQKFTLPDLEARLEVLADGEQCRITTQDYERLFGTNDAALGRVRNFAKLHACRVSFSANDTLFRKALNDRTS